MGVRNHKMLTFSFLSTDDAEKQATIEGDFRPGFTHTVVITVANFTNPITLTFKHYTPDGAVLYSIADLPENKPVADPNILLYERPIFPGCKIGILPSGVPGSAGDVTVTIYSRT